MSRPFARKTTLVTGIVIVVLLTVPVVLVEGLYRYGLRNYHDLPPLQATGKVDPKFTDAIWANAGEKPPYVLEPIRPWDLLVNYLLVNREKLAAGEPYRKGEGVAIVCSRLRLAEQKTQRTRKEYRLAGLTDMVWLSRHVTPEALTSCIYEKSRFPCDGRGYVDGAIKLLNKSSGELDLNDLLTLAAAAYYGPSVEDRTGPIKRRRDKLIDIYRDNGIIPKPYADKLKEEPLPEMRQCSAPPPPDGG